MAAPAYAQDAADDSDADAPAQEIDNEIIVSGFRASLESAQNIKRDSDTFVAVSYTHLTLPTKA